MLAKNNTSGKILLPKHNIDQYIKMKLKEYGWENQELADRSGISKGEISKLKNGLRDALSSKIFYQIYTAFDDSCKKAINIVYPDLNLTPNKIIEKKRNSFGKYMSAYEEIKNSIEIISEKTGIALQRLKDLYYRTGAPEAYELLLIEKAIEKKPGEVFEELYGQKNGGINKTK